MRYFRLRRREVQGGARLADSLSPPLKLHTGAPLEDFLPPVRVALEQCGGLPTFFDSPGWIVRRDFADALGRLGVSNLETWAVDLPGVDAEYVLINVLGCGPAASRHLHLEGRELVVTEHLAERLAGLGDDFELSVAE